MHDGHKGALAATHMADVYGDQVLRDEKEFDSWQLAEREAE